MTLDDLGLLLEELMRVREQWYRLGLQLKVRPETLETIRKQFSDPRGQIVYLHDPRDQVLSLHDPRDRVLSLHDPRDKLREMLKVWLTTSDNPSWKTLTDALRSRTVEHYWLAAVLEAKYCQTKVHESKY